MKPTYFVRADGHFPVSPLQLFQNTGHRRDGHLKERKGQWRVHATRLPEVSSPQTQQTHCKGPKEPVNIRASSITPAADASHKDAISGDRGHDLCVTVTGQKNLPTNHFQGKGGGHYFQASWRPQAEQKVQIQLIDGSLQGTNCRWKKPDICKWNYAKELWRK